MMKRLILASLIAIAPSISQAEILPEATVEIKIPLTKKPTTRPMTVAYLPESAHYYIADGGLAPMGSAYEAPVSKSEVHAFDKTGKYLNSALPGYDNRSLYYNPNTKQLETVTYNVSADAGFFPNSGIFSLQVSEAGEITNKSGEVTQTNPAFGDAATMPSYNYDANLYYAKQEKNNKVYIVDLKSREKTGEIALDFKAAGAQHHDVSDHYIAYTGVKGEELCLLDVDHKTALLYNLKGELVGKSALPKHLKLRSQNHFNGIGYTNGMLFVYNEKEGDFGTYYGLKVVK